MSTPNVRSTKDIIVLDSTVSSDQEKELAKAENCINFIDCSVQALENIAHNIADLDHIALGNNIRSMKPAIMSMGYTMLYSTATALENEFLNQIISYPRPNLEDFIAGIDQAIRNTNMQLEGMRVSLI